MLKETGQEIIDVSKGTFFTRERMLRVLMLTIFLVLVTLAGFWSGYFVAKSEKADLYQTHWEGCKITMYYAFDAINQMYDIGPAEQRTDAFQKFQASKDIESDTHCFDLMNKYESDDREIDNWKDQYSEFFDEPLATPVAVP